MIISINVSNKLRVYEHYVIYCKYLCSRNKQDRTKWKYLNTSVESPWSGY